MLAGACDSMGRPAGGNFSFGNPGRLPGEEQ
jgi:hypothetical protein